jgi:AraC family transcriptional regulator of adaptative response/methylated-DNA-[protein]-cysteine methyltransferase
MSEFESKSRSVLSAPDAYSGAIDQRDEAHMKTINRDAARAQATVNDPRWAAVRTHDPKSDGRFFYSVRSTGVYCRPGCAARTPRHENVAFYATAAEAERAGFRACKRCRPDAPPRAAQLTQRIAELCRFIETTEPVPALDVLARRAGMSVSHLHRVFKSVTGLTPKGYADAHRAGRMRHELTRGGTVTDAIYGAGYNSNGRFYEHADEVLGMTPSAYRAGGANTRIRFAIGECSLGAILVAQSERGVCAILMGDDPQALVRDLQDQFPHAELVGADPAFERLVAQVVGLIEAPARGLDLPLDVRGTGFQQRVWTALRDIPAGATASYTEIARRVGAPKAARAVAQACGANALAVAIPCHRVVRTDGALSGYRWGVERKRELLGREARA